MALKVERYRKITLGRASYLQIDIGWGVTTVMRLDSSIFSPYGEAIFVICGLLRDSRPTLTVNV